MTRAPAAAAVATSGRQIATGAAWMMLFKLLDKGVGLISTLILARLLTPADFGLVAMAMAVVALTQLMSAFGFDSALIQRADASRPHFDTAWTFNVLFGTAIALVLCALAWPAAGFYGEPRLSGVLLLLALASFIGGLENIGVVAFRKDMDFRSEFRFLLLKRLAGFAVTLVLAFSLRSYWALVGGVLTTRLLSVLISYRLHPYRPRLSLAARADLMHFSKWILLSSLISFVSSRSTDFILGRTVGAHGLGVYSIGYEIATMPSTELIAPVNRAVYPAYARLAPDPQALIVRFRQVFGLICLVAFPVSLGLIAVADAAVRVVLGSKWLETVPLIQVFAYCGLASALQSNLYLVVVALGKPQANTALSAGLVVVTLPLIIWGSLVHGVAGASYAAMFNATAGMLGIVFVFKRYTHISVSVLLDALWPPLLSALVMAGTVYAVDAGLVRAPLEAWPLPRLLVLLATGAVVYPLAALALWALRGQPTDSAEAVSIEFLKQRFSALRRPRSSAAAAEPHA